MRVYTDGSCLRNQLGGWAWWNEDTDERESGVEFPTTNSRMELYAIIDAVDSFLDDEELVIVSDSQYVVNSINEGWLDYWRAHEWRSARGRKIDNVDLWDHLGKLLDAHGKANFEWVRGHSGDPGNEMADSLATSVVELAMGDN